MKSLLQTKWISLALLTASFLLIYNPLTHFPYTFCVIIIFILISTYLQNGDLRSLNFKHLKSGDITKILVSYLILELSVDFMIQPLVNWLCNEPADYSTFEHIKGDTAQYLKWLYRM
jgi:hypothetical protein